MNPPAAAPDPAALLRSKAYLRLLVLAGLVGAPISAFAFFFLRVVAELQQVFFTDLPKDVLGFGSTPAWWPLPVLALSGLLAAIAIR